MTVTTHFYAPPDNVRNGRVTLPPDESTHAARVLRHQPGDVVSVVDGFGALYLVELDEVTAKEVSGRIVETVTGAGEAPHGLTVAIGLLKQPARFETFVEKAVELGISRIIPLRTERTEKTQLKLDRLNRIAVAAMKQCGRSRLPELTGVLTLDEVLASDESVVRIACHESAQHARLITSVLAENSTGSVSILIGPEGGFSEGEIATATGGGFVLARLGSRRLRGETAGIAAASAAMFWMEEEATQRRPHATE